MRYVFAPEQRTLLQTLSVPFDPFAPLTPRQGDQLFEAVERHLQTHGLENDQVTELSRICESILDVMYDQGRK